MIVDVYLKHNQFVDTLQEIVAMCCKMYVCTCLAYMTHYISHHPLLGGMKMSFRLFYQNSSLANIPFTCKNLQRGNFTNGSCRCRNRHTDTVCMIYQPVVFLLSDAQIVEESFLEDINGIVKDPSETEDIVQETNICNKILIHSRISNHIFTQHRAS